MVKRKKYYKNAPIEREPGITPLGQGSRIIIGKITPPKSYKTTDEGIISDYKLYIHQSNFAKFAYRISDEKRIKACENYIASVRAKEKETGKSMLPHVAPDTVSVRPIITQLQKVMLGEKRTGSYEDYLKRAKKDESIKLTYEEEQLLVIAHFSKTFEQDIRNKYENLDTAKNQLLFAKAIHQATMENIAIKVKESVIEERAKFAEKKEGASKEKPSKQKLCTSEMLKAELARRKASRCR